MPFSNAITKLFNIQYPVVQAGMVWASGWRLASAVSNAGGLGLIGSGSMYPHILKEHIQKCKAATNKPFGVNLPLIYLDVEEHVKIILEEDIRIVFTSAGDPKKYTALFRQHGIIVTHVVSSSKFAIKAQAADCDAVVAEGFEAGGHNGRNETTTFVLVPAVKQAVQIPVIAAGGIATGMQMFAAMALGAQGVQMGSRFVCSEEASSHIAFKGAVVKADEGDTMLTMKKHIPVRLIKNDFYKEINEAESKGASAENIKQILGSGRAKKGMFEGDLANGELEIGQSSVLIHDILPAAEIVKNIWSEFKNAEANPLGDN